jgi:two-component system OmpR family sensor kinase
MLDRIERESIRIDRLIEELLTLSKLENKDPGAADEEVCIDDVLTEIVDSARFEGEAERKVVHISATKGIIVRGKHELLQSAIENVVRNAVKHTYPEKDIRIEADWDVETNKMRLAVSDSGPGVPDTELDSIFEPYYRGSTGASFTGYGLGLAISRRIVQVYGGTIRAFNIDQGGLCVEIVMPVDHQKESTATAA